ncbi:MAG: hypothetical protein Q9183_002063 [Haloplaca sp. 2 TL-2023]
MPTYRNITINLISQLGILNIPEYDPPAAAHDPFSEPQAIVDNSLVSCYVPIYPLSQFWFQYNISAPHPPRALYFFKLFINGTCIVSWGCGEENGFKGSTMYGLYDSGERCTGEPGVDMRGFGFARGAASQGPSDAMLERVMEIKVYRSRCRRRIQPELEEFKTPGGQTNKHVSAPKSSGPKLKAASTKGGISMFNAGSPDDGHPCRFYTYSLLDPLDAPFATFRWHYRTWAQLEALGITTPMGSPNQSPADAVGDPMKLKAKSDSNHSTPENKKSPLGSPSSTSDVSPFTIRGLTLPAIPFIDLPRPGSPSATRLQRTRSPVFMPSSHAATAPTPGRFAQLICR